MSTSGGSSGNTTTTQNLPDWAQPYATELLQRGAALSNTTTPSYTGQTVAGLNGTQTGAIGGLSSAATSSASTADAANAYYQSLLGSNGAQITNPYSGNVTAAQASSKYADPSTNPYLASTVNASNQRIEDAYSNVTAPTTLAQFRNAGAFGGSAQQQATTAQQNSLLNALSDNTSTMYNSAYNTAAGVDSSLAQSNAAQANAVALANQSAATGANTAYNSQNSSNYYNFLNAQQNALTGATSANTAASGANTAALAGGNVAQANSQDSLNAAYQAWLQQINQPYSQLSTLSSALSGALGSGTGITTQQSSSGSGNTLATLLGLGATGAGIYAAS